jgi:two-component system response regulator (stage 0 sporulation protein A)
MNVEFKDGKAIMSIDDFMKHFNSDEKVTVTQVISTSTLTSDNLVTSGNKDVYDVTTDIIMRKGLKPNLKGFKYTRKAVELCVSDPDYLEMITKRLYPEIAKEFKTTSSRTERAIRHAIEVRYTGQKPTNSEFIAQLVEEVSAEMKIQRQKVS